MGVPLFSLRLHYSHSPSPDDHYAPEAPGSGSGRERTREFYAEHPEEQSLWLDALSAYLSGVPRQQSSTLVEAPTHSEAGAQRCQAC